MMIVLKKFVSKSAAGIEDHVADELLSSELEHKKFPIFCCAYTCNFLEPCTYMHFCWVHFDIRKMTPRSTMQDRLKSQ